MKKTKKLTSALIGALTLSMTLGGFVAPPAMAEPVSPPGMIYCAEHINQDHIVVTSIDDPDVHFYFYENFSYDFTELILSEDDTTRSLDKFSEMPTEGNIYVWSGNKFISCNSWSESPIPTCDHTDLTHHEAAAGTDCQHNGTIEYWQCNNEDCGKMFEDEACKTEIENTSDGKYGEHNMEVKHNSLQHWDECAVCRIKEDVEWHTYDDKDNTYTCTGCGFEDVGRYINDNINLYELIYVSALDEIQLYGFPEEIADKYTEMVTGSLGTFAEQTQKAEFIEPIDKAQKKFEADIEIIKSEVFAEYKEQVTKSLDSLNEELTNAVKYADVHDLSRDAAMELLAVINEAGKNEIVAGGTKEGVDNAHETAASSQRSIAEMIFNYEMFDILDGEDITILQNSDDTVSVRADALCERFLGVTVDEELVAPENYTVESGSTIVTFNNDFLNTLTVGKHTVAMVWIDGMSTSKLTIVAPVIMPRTVEAPKADDAGIAPLALDPVVEKKAEVKADAPAAVAEAVKTNEIPSTGDNNMMTMWLALAAIALAAGTGAVVYKKESR